MTVGSDQTRLIVLRPKDLLSAIREHVIPETSILQTAISLILAETQLLQVNRL